MNEIIIVHNKYNKDSQAFVDANPSYQVIDFYDHEAADTKEYHSLKLPNVGEFPSVVNTVKKIASSNPATIAEAEAEIDALELENKAGEVRSYRSAVLNNSDRYMISDYPVGSATAQEILDYRQALRDVPEQGGFPNSITWPEDPTLS